MPATALISIYTGACHEGRCIYAAESQRRRPQQGRNGSASIPLCVSRIAGCANLRAERDIAFRTKDTNLVSLAIKIESAIERSFGFRPSVILRTTAEIRAAIAANPPKTVHGQR